MFESEQVQRSCGTSVSGGFRGQQGDQGGWSTGSGGQSHRRSGPSNEWLHD